MTIHHSALYPVASDVNTLHDTAARRDIGPSSNSLHRVFRSGTDVGQQAAKLHHMPKAQNGYVDHPRYGAAPRFTGLDADMDCMDVHLHYRLRTYTRPMLEAFRLGGWQIPKAGADDPRLISGTAIAADLSRQTPATVPVSHYYDEERRCIDCRRLFVFFAEEQRYWYEELRFSLDADCVRCYPCRRRQQDIERTKRDYDELMTLIEPSPDDMARMAFARLLLVESGRFHPRQLDLVRAFLRQHPDHEHSPAIRAGLERLT